MRDSSSLKYLAQKVQDQNKSSRSLPVNLSQISQAHRGNSALQAEQHQMLKYAYCLNYSLSMAKELEGSANMTLHKTLLQGLIVSLQDQINNEIRTMRLPSPTATENAGSISPAGMSVPYVASDNESDFGEDEGESSFRFEDTDERLMDLQDVPCMNSSNAAYSTPESLDSFHASLVHPFQGRDSEDIHVEQLMASILTEHG